jgi:hypothetical protein
VIEHPCAMLVPRARDCVRRTSARTFRDGFGTFRKRQKPSISHRGVFTSLYVGLSQSRCLCPCSPLTPPALRGSGSAANTGGGCCARSTKHGRWSTNQGGERDPGGTEVRKGGSGVPGGVGGHGLR